MLRWALLFLVLALGSGAFAAVATAEVSAGIAQTLFFVFLVLFVIAMVRRVAEGH